MQALVGVGVTQVNLAFFSNLVDVHTIHPFNVHEVLFQGAHGHGLGIGRIGDQLLVDLGQQRFFGPTDFRVNRSLMQACIDHQVAKLDVAFR